MSIGGGPACEAAVVEEQWNSEPLQREPNQPAKNQPMDGRAGRNRRRVTAWPPFLAGGPPGEHHKVEDKVAV